MQTCLWESSCGASRRALPGASPEGGLQPALPDGGSGTATNSYRPAEQYAHRRERKLLNTEDERKKERKTGKKRQKAGIPRAMTTEGKEKMTL